MSDDSKNREGDPDFEDDFDDLDFDDADLEGGIEDAGYEDISEEDLEGGDFPQDEEWEEEFPGEEEEQAQPSARRGFGREQNLYTDTRERKSFNLSFNTMVIIGALMVGGSVLAYTVMTKTAEVNAAKPSVFRSMLNIGSVLDGGIFGGQEETAPDTAATETGTASDQGQAPAEQGFLDNPDQALPTNEQAEIPVVEGAPPAPTPIAPPEEDVITPLPDEHVPRGPEDTSAVASNGEESAQAIIEAAIANRENKNGEDAPAPVIEETVVAAPVEEESAPVIAEQPVPIPAPQPAGLSEEDKAKMAQAQERASAAETQVADLQKQIADLQAKLRTVEGELDTARANNSDEASASDDLEKTVAALKADLEAASDKAESERLARTQAEAEAAKAKKEAEAAKKEASAKIASAEKEKAAAKSAADAARKEAAAKPAPVKKAPAKTASSPVPKKAPAVAETKSARWELRAAQPGRAWVSKPGARDMQSVTVGETLPGIGRVTAISYVNGRWTVQGTQGQVAQ